MAPAGRGNLLWRRQIGAKTGLPVIHLDVVYWHEGWTEMPKDVWERTVRELTRQPEWITDGNYGGTMELRLAAADMVVFLDLPPLVCVWRVVRRWRQYRHESRPDMAPGCPEKLDWVFLRWIWNYRRDRRPDILKRMNKYAKGRRLVQLQSSWQVRRFLQTLPQS